MHEGKYGGPHTGVSPHLNPHPLNFPFNSPTLEHVVVSSAMLATPTTRAYPPLPQGLLTRAYEEPYKHSSWNLRMRWSSSPRRNGASEEKDAIRSSKEKKRDDVSSLFQNPTHDEEGRCRLGQRVIRERRRGST